ncbi:hypothetical protein [Rubritalea tangerina]|uniref:hypothetical protein n=1 Tax=Rubritalea tangerina TaxID=430798 RepID=UPI003620AA0A
MPVQHQPSRSPLAISFFVLAHNRRDPHLYYTGTLFSLLLASTAARIDFAPSWFATSYAHPPHPLNKNTLHTKL